MELYAYDAGQFVFAERVNLCVATCPQNSTMPWLLTNSEQALDPASRVEGYVIFCCIFGVFADNLLTDPSFNWINYPLEALEFGIKAYCFGALPLNPWR